jgi:hypothetical protein
MQYHMHILRFYQSEGIKLKNSIPKNFLPTKIVVILNDRNQSAFNLGMIILGFEIRLPCYIYNRQRETEL